MKKRIFASLLAAALLVGSLAACSNNSNNSSANASRAENTSQIESDTGEESPSKRNINGLELPIVDEPTEISILIPYDGKIVEDINEIAGVKAMEEATGIHVNWTFYTQSEMPERFQQLLATGEYFDIMFPGGAETYPGGYQQGIEDGVLVDMVDHIDQYMPNYKAKLESNAQAMKEATYDDGRLHAVKVVKGTDEKVQGSGSTMGAAYRADILEAMGEDIPETVDDLHELLIKCRDNGMTAPMTLQSDGGTTLSLAWGINTDWSTDYWQYDPATQTVNYPPFTPNWDNYLDTMRDWYAEGLVDKNFTAGSPLLSGDYSNFENDRTLFIDFWFNWLMGNELCSQGFISNENCNIKAITGITLKEGDTPTVCGWDPCVAQEIFVTTQAEDKIEIVSKWLDYLYTPEANNYKYYGIEGESYNIASDGSIALTDTVLNDPNGLSIADALGKYALRSYIGYQSVTGENATVIASAADGYVPLLEATEVWSNSDAVNIHLPDASLSLEESEFVNRYMTDITTLMQERMVKYIMGTDTSSHDEFREKLKSYNIEGCIERWQAAVDRYNAK